MENILLFKYLSSYILLFKVPDRVRSSHPLVLLTDQLNTEGLKSDTGRVNAGGGQC